MIKKLKILLLSGALSLSMATGVFADGNGNDGCQLGTNVPGEHDGNQHKISNVTQADWETYVDTVNTTNTGIVIEGPNNLNGNGWHTYKVYADTNYDHEKDNNQQIEVVHIKFLTSEDKGDKPITPDDKPILPPGTGDTSIMPLVIGAGAIVSTLIVVNVKKKDE